MVLPKIQVILISSAFPLSWLLLIARAYSHDPRAKIEPKMPKLAITDIAVHQLRTPGVYMDTRLPAFGIRIGKHRKTWLIVSDQRRARKAIGYYPEMSVAKARDTARQLLASRSQHHPITFEEALDQFLGNLKSTVRKSTYDGTSRHLDGYLRTKLAKRPLGDVKTHEVMNIIDTLRESPSEASHAFAAAKQFFRWACGRGYCVNVLDSLKPPSKSTPRARVLTDAEVKSIWRACEANRGMALVGEQREPLLGDPPPLPAAFCTIVKLLIATGQRRGEITALRPSYIDIEKRTICLPSDLVKNGREHTLPFGALAAGLLSRATEGAPSTAFIFPARGNANASFNGWSKAKAALDKASGVTGWTLHDLRRTFATRLAETGIAPHVIERILNHTTGSLSPIARVYNKAKYQEEMRAAIEVWEAKLAKLLEQS